MRSRLKEVLVFDTRQSVHRFLVIAIVCLTTLQHAWCQGQEESEVLELSSETTVKYGRALRALKDIEGFLRAIEFEKSAIIGTNFFSVSVGGIDAIKDLEEGRGVDPETFAGLYSGFALPEVAEHLNAEPKPGGGIRILSPDGRLRYKGTVVRLYSPDRLRELFARRDGFRNGNERARREAFSEYVYGRKRESGQLEQVSEGSEITELIARFRRLQPLLVELDAALQNERQVTSILPGETTPHLFGISLGGIDVAEDLRTRNAVDPESLAAIYAQQVSTDYAASFEVGNDGSIIYDGTPIKLYSVERLEWCFKVRERLDLQSSRR